MNASVPPHVLPEFSPRAMPAAMLEARLPDGTVLRGGTATELAALVRALR